MLLDDSALGMVLFLSMFRAFVIFFVTNIATEAVQENENAAAVPATYITIYRYLHEPPHREDSFFLANSPQKQEFLELREAPTVSSPLPGGFFQVGCFGVEELRL